jgi:RNA polymerase sigma-70 factor (ECF subfamily)
MPKETEGLDAIYTRHAPGVFRRARRLLGSDADAHEVVQELFLSLFERPEQYSGKSALTTFMYSATTHACLNRIRNKKTRLRLLERHASVSDEEERDPRMTPEVLYDLHRALERMPEELARVAVHYCVDDLSHDEIARLLDCSRRHVGNLLERVGEWSRSQEVTPC